MQEKQSFHFKNFHNEVYKTFVDNNEDLVGMIAYSLYKEKKIKFIEDLVNNNTSDDEIKNQIENFKNRAISERDIYFDAALNVSQNFIEIHYRNVIDDDNRATLLAENRQSASKLHLILMFIWGTLITIGFIVLGFYFYYLKDSNLYKVGTSFKDNREILFYLLEKYSRRIFIIAATFYAIKILWYNFKLSFHSLIINTHNADNLRIFDYLKNDDMNTNNELITKDSLKYIFIEAKPEESSKDTNELGQKLLNKITDKIDSIFESAADVVKKK
ncbi:hypothetical protein A6C57_01140 [Fibrella sp. ES10-3-2-2]|nr:hypothetical protein A6C57_01140 [Fibrella sp. ES10-3-2-2]